MHAGLQLVERFEELLTRRDADLPYDFHTLFPNEGFWSRRASQKRLALLKKLDESLRAMLRPGERVLFLTQGIAYSFWESYFFGLPMYYLNRRALALTNERILLLQIDSRRRARQLRSQIRLGAITEFRRTGLGNTSLRLTSGKRYVFVYLPRRDWKHLSSLLSATKSQQAAVVADLEQLCPFCLAVVEHHPTACPACHGALKSWVKAGRLSMLFPGLGDIYLGHSRLAVLEMLVAGLFWLNFVLGILYPDPRAPAGGMDIGATAVFGLLLVHGGDALTTFHIAKKGHYPAQESQAAHPSAHLPTG